MGNEAGSVSGSGRKEGRAPRWTVLVVEDEETVRTVARRILERAGHEVLEAESGERAIAIASEAGTLDAVVSDVVMPGINGPHAVQQIRSCHPGVAVLYTSGFPDVERREHGLEDETLLAKPYNRTELLAKLESLVHAR